MMDRETAKTIAGLLSIVTLLALIVIDVTSQDYTLTDRYLYILIGLISAFLGVDMLVGHERDKK